MELENIVEKLKIMHEKAKKFEETKIIELKNIIEEVKILNMDNVIISLPSVENAGIMAVEISEKVKPELTSQEQAFFVAGFQECVKFLKLEINEDINMNKIKNKPDLRIMFEEETGCTPDSESVENTYTNWLEERFLKITN